VSRNGDGPSPMSVEVRLDDTTVRVPQGSTILEAARAAGVEIPTLCYHETLAPIGACRMCVVEVEGSRTLVAACERSVQEGMVVRTDSARVRTSRRMVAELLQTEADTSRAPDVLRCAGEYGAEPERWEREIDAGIAKQSEPKVDNELYVRDPDRCIMCYRCVEACGEQVQNTFAIAVAGRGHEARIDTGFDLPLPESACVYCGNCVAVCPTEALAFKAEFDLKESGAWRPERQSVTQSTCPYCGVGCQIEVHVQEGRIFKATAPLDDPTTRGYLCIKGRFGWEYVHAGLIDEEGGRATDDSDSLEE